MNKALEKDLEKELKKIKNSKIEIVTLNKTIVIFTEIIAGILKNENFQAISQNQD